MLKPHQIRKIMPFLVVISFLQGLWTTVSGAFTWLIK